jgi:hypothetical protein
MNKNITKTFTITCSPKFMEKFERFLSMMYLYGRWGHSANIGIFVDGDGNENPIIEPINETYKKYRKDISLISGVGGELEQAQEDRFTVLFIDNSRNTWYSKDGILFKNNVEYKKYQEH